MAILGTAPIGTELTVTIPPGTYYVGDPCYVLADADYGARYEGIGTNIANNALMEFPDRGVLLNWSTVVGDGRYFFFAEHPGTVAPTMGLAVDSGQLALIDVRLCDPAKLEKRVGKDGPSGMVIFTEPITLTVDEHGNLDDEDGLLNVLVHDDEDYGDDEEDEEDGDA